MREGSRARTGRGQETDAVGRATFDNTTLSALDENGNPNSQLSFSGSWTTGTEAGLGGSGGACCRP